MQLPLLKNIDLLATKWKSILDPVLSNPLTNLTILKDVFLTSGNNQIAHKLGRVQQGWYILDVNGAATIYRYQYLNDTYLYLNSDAPVICKIGVF